jgi:hypothetical protein
LLLLLIAGGAMAAVAVFAIALSVASFTTETRSTGNSLQAGKASLSLSPADRIVDASNLRRNVPRSGDVVVTNTGERAAVSVRVTGASGALASALSLTITPRGAPGSQLYNGSLAAAGTVALGSLNAGATAAWTFTIALFPTAQTALVAATLDVAFEWEARTL